MTVSYLGSAESIRTATTDPYTFTYTPTGSPRGIAIAAVHGTTATDHVSAVTYGGVALTRADRRADTTTEPGAAEWWFLGSGVPAGAQTVSVDFTSATGDDFHIVVIELGGAKDLEVIAADGLDANVANPSVTLPYSGRTSIALGALYGGGAAPADFTPNANCTTVQDHDLGAFYSEVIRQTTPGSADFAIGGTSGTDDVAFSAIAVSETIFTKPLTGGLTFAGSLDADHLPAAPPPVSHSAYFASANIGALTDPTFAVSGVSWSPGDLILVFYSGRDDGATTSGVTDDGPGETYTQLRHLNDPQFQTYGGIWSAKATGTGSGATVTLQLIEDNIAADGGIGMTVVVVSGDDPQVDAHSQADNGGVDTATPSVDLTTVEAATRRYALFQHRNRTWVSQPAMTPVNGPINGGAAGNIVALQSGASGGVQGTSLYYKDEDTAGSKTAAGTLNTVTEWLALAVSVYDASGGAIPQALSGGLSFAGSAVKAPRKSLAGALTFAGSIAKRPARALAGTLTTAGAAAKRTARGLTGGLTSSGALAASKVAVRSLTAGLTFAGAIAKRPGKSLAGTVGSSGALSRRAARSLAAAIAPTGALATTKVLVRALSGGLTFTGAIARRPGKALAGSLAFAGSIARRPARGLAGAVTFAGATTRRTARALAGGLTSAGTLATARFRAIALSATLATAGALSRRTARIATGALSFAGTASRRPARPLTAALPLAGALGRSARRSLAATLGTVGTLARRPARALAGAIGPSGSIARQTRRTAAASLATAGSLARSTRRALGGAVTFAGSLVGDVIEGAQTYTKDLTAALTFAGSSSRRTARQLTAALAPAGLLSRAGSLRRTFTASLAPAGALHKAAQRRLTAGLASAGTVRRQAGKSLAGAVLTAGTLTRLGTYQRALTAALDFTGALPRRMTRSLAGGLSFAGTVAGVLRSLVRGRGGTTSRGHGAPSARGRGDTIARTSGDTTARGRGTTTPRD